MARILIRLELLFIELIFSPTSGKWLSILLIGEALLQSISVGI